MINKELIHDRFAKSLKSYDENAKVQKRMAKKLASFIKNKTPKRILEIGCGTGFLTKEIIENCTYNFYQTIDIVEDCKEYITKINPEIIFTATDIEDYLKLSNDNFDLIISNASLQWVENFESVIYSLKNMLNPNGELIFTTFGKENFREIYNILGATLNYYSISDLEKTFPKSYIEQEIHILAFESPKEVLRHLQNTGVNAIENKSWTKGDLKKFEQAYESMCVKRPTLTYNPIYIIINK